MKRRRLKKSVIYALYGLCFTFILSIGIIFEFKNKPKEEKVYVNDIVVEENIPVIKEENKIVKPFIKENIQIGRYFYNYNDSLEKQNKSLINYDNTFIPNSGIDFIDNSKFEIVSILDGKVTKVTENNILGKIVEITYDNNLIGVYQSISEIQVKAGDNVIQGQIIAKSGESNIAKELGNHLHFELIHNGKNVNPENYFGKTLGEI